jgi:hypothetical protein
MQVVDKTGNIFGIGIEITGPDGKPKTTGGGGGAPSGPAGGDLSGVYPNPSVVWSNGIPTYDLSYYPLLLNPAGYLTSASLSTYLTIASAALTYYPIPTGTISQYIRGDGTLATFPTITSGTVTSVGLSMPSAFTVGSSPVTTSGTIAVTGAGVTSQYIRGDGTLATFPSIPTVTPAALTKTDDTNVTLTLGGTPSTALLQATSLTLGWTGTLADSRIASASTWNAKQNAITTGTTAQYFRGDLSLATFPTIPTVTPSGLTKVDDTNVTLTLGGTPSTALLQSTSLTLGWTGTLADSRIASASTWNAKQNAITTGTTAQYFRGDLSLATFPTIPTVGTWGALNYPSWSSGTPFVKMTAAGTFALDTNTYITGNQSITLSGDVSGTGTTAITTAIGTNKVTNAMLAQIVTSTIQGRVTAGTGNVETLTGTQATTLINVFTSTLKGLAPASGGGTTNFLRADGTWTTPAGSSGVTQIVAGTNVTISPLGGTGIVTVNASGGGGGSTPVKLTSQTLTAASWTLSGGYYTYSFSNVNITTTCDVSVTPQNASYLTAYNAQVLPFVGVAAGVATFYSQFPPQANMIVDIVITQTT